MTRNEQQKWVVVLGAGVIGLSTAIKIQERGGYKVTIVAETLPTDPKSIRYTSHYAGAQHVTGATKDDARQRRMDRETYDMFWELSAPGSEAEHCFLRVQQTEFYAGERIPAPLEEYPGACNPLPNQSPILLRYRPLDKHELLPGTKAGITFNSVNTDTPTYLAYLHSRFVRAGGVVVRGAVQHIDQLLKGGAEVFVGRGATHGTTVPGAVVVCAGLGARFLGGVEDKAMHPVRGQTVLLRAPWIRFSRTISDEKGLWTYVIPRRSGDVIVGGTKAYEDWDPSIRPETTQDILERTLAMCPELAPPEIRERRATTIEDLVPLIVEENTGLRPNRDGGIRLEVEMFDGEPGEQKIPVVYNYGHGGFGFIGSWGSANMALELLEDALAKF